eukprot:4176715-Alexandrium_andersonii.AAC.1
MKALDEAKAALAKATTQSHDDFKAIVLGGPAHMAQHGKAYHSVCGVTRGGLAKDFCKRRGVQYTFRCSYALYGDAACGILARAWCHKMQHYFNLELASSEGEDLVFTSEHRNTYSEPTELQKLLAEGHPNPALLQRVEALRSLLC